VYVPTDDINHIVSEAKLPLLILTKIISHQVLIKAIIIPPAKTKVIPVPYRVTVPLPILPCDPATPLSAGGRAPPPVPPVLPARAVPVACGPRSVRTSFESGLRTGGGWG